MSKLSFKKRFFICVFSTIIGLFLVDFCLNQMEKKEELARENYDYSKIKEYQGTVIRTDNDYTRGGGDRKTVYILLDNGKKIGIGIGGASSRKKGERVSVYTDNDTRYSFNKESVVTGYHGFGYYILSILIIFTLILLYVFCFGWKGFTVGIIVLFLCYCISEAQ